MTAEQKGNDTMSKIKNKEDASVMVDYINLFRWHKGLDKVVITYPYQNQKGNSDVIDIICYDEDFWTVLHNENVIEIFKSFDKMVNFVWKNRRTFNKSLSNAS
jgi:hypothetical protein